MLRGKLDGENIVILRVGSLLGLLKSRKPSTLIHCRMWGQAPILSWI